MAPADCFRNSHPPAAWSWGEVFFYGVPSRGLPGQEYLLYASFHGPTWLTGGAFGPEARLAQSRVADYLGDLLLDLAARSDIPEGDRHFAGVSRSDRWKNNLSPSAAKILENSP
jgi:hypothetical protein